MYVPDLIFANLMHTGDAAFGDSEIHGMMLHEFSLNCADELIASIAKACNDEDWTVMRSHLHE